MTFVVVVAAGVYVGERPYPADGYPVLGFISSNVYIAGEQFAHKHVHNHLDKAASVLSLVALWVVHWV
jgi:hypothetical protein